MTRQDASRLTVLRSPGQCASLWPDPAPSLPVGTHVLILLVRDETGNVVTDELTIIVEPQATETETHMAATPRATAEPAAIQRIGRTTRRLTVVGRPAALPALHILGRS